MQVGGNRGGLNESIPRGNPEPLRLKGTSETIEGASPGGRVGSDAQEALVGPR